MTVITRQQLDDQQLTSVTDALRVVPGIALSHDDSERHFLYSRGFTTTIVMVDGLRSYDQDASSSFLTQVDTATLDRVEVVRGASGLLKGVGNPSAAISLVHKRPTDTLQGYVSAGVGSWNRYRAEGDLSGPLNTEGTLRARGVVDYESRNSFVKAYHKEAYTLYGTLEYDLTPDTLLSASIDFQNNDTDGSTYGANPLFWSDGSRMVVDRSFNVASRGSYVKSQNRKVYVDLTHHFSPDWQLRVRLTDSHTMRDVLVRELYASAPPNKTTGAATIYNTTFNPKREARGADAMLTGKVDLGGWDADVVAGFSYTRGVLTRTDRIKNEASNIYTWDTNIAPLEDWSGATVSARRTSERETSLYGTVRLHPVKALSVILGTNFETYKLDDIVNGKVNSAPRENGRFVPYAGLVYDLTHQFSLYGSYTSIFNPATTYDANDRLLNPVSGNNVEGGIKGAFMDGRLNASLAGFYIKQNNVAVVMSGVITPLGQQAYQSANGVTSKGVEAEIAGEILPGWQVQGGVTYMRAKTAAGARVNTGMPQSQAKVATSYRFHDGKLKGLMIGANATWQDSTYYVTSFGTASQGNVAVVGLIGGYEVNSHLSASVVLNNLFDKTYYDGYGLYTSYTYGAPRNVLFTLRYKL
jgi:outer membrane receptor for ferric coprogen and ferric-rhodotorulic acid